MSRTAKFYCSRVFYYSVFISLVFRRGLKNKKNLKIIKFKKGKRKKRKKPTQVSAATNMLHATGLNAKQKIADIS